MSKLRFASKASLLTVTHALSLFWGVRAFEGPWTAGELALGGLLGYAYVDVLTVVTHFAIDNYFSVRTPLIGPVVYYFREHHETPEKMFERGYVDNNFEQCLVALPFLLVCFSLRTGPGGRMFIAIAALAGCYITQIHKWAHEEKPPTGVRLLQRARVIVGPRHHRGHHVLPDSNYALCAGWMDRPFAWLGVLDVATAVVYLLSGHTPINRGPNMAAAGPTTFSQRLGRLQWNAWYRFLAWYARRRGARFHCMNWGYEDGATAVSPSQEERYPLQLYERALRGVEVRGKRVVEVSSGRGGGLAYLAETKRPRSAIGVDFVAGNVRASREAFAGEISGLSYREGDATATGLPEASADVVLNIEASHCYPSFAGFLGEVRRVLAPRGTLVVADFRPAVEMDRLRSDCVDGGFEIVAETDLTAGVLEAMRLDGERRLALIRDHAHRWLHPLLRNFAAADDSAATFRRLHDRSYVYFLLQMQRTWSSQQDGGDLR